MKNNKDFVRVLIKEMNQSYDKSGLKKPHLADLNKDKKISSYEKKRGAAVEKNIDEAAPVQQDPYGNRPKPKATKDKHPAGTPGMTEGHEGHDHEVSMANNSLDSILWAANELKKHLGDEERDIPAWIQDHITNAENYIIQAAKNFHDYGDSEEDEYEDDEFEYDLEDDYENDYEGDMDYEQDYEEDLMEAKSHKIKKMKREGAKDSKKKIKERKKK
jgi:hypothetical protein